VILATLRRSPFHAFLAGVAALVAAPSARADEDDRVSRWAPSIALDGVVGLGTPVGFGGGMLEYTAIPWLTLSAGLGANGQGLQEALGVRLRGSPRPGVAFAFGVCGSTGPYAAAEPLIAFFDTPQDNYTWKRAYWINVDFSIERRWDNGLEMRWFMGLATLANNSATSCVTWDSPSGSGQPMSCNTEMPRQFLTGYIPYLGYALGFASPL
jgi:hypothetical protein